MTEEDEGVRGTRANKAAVTDQGGLAATVNPAYQLYRLYLAVKALPLLPRGEELRGGLTITIEKRGVEAKAGLRAWSTPNEGSSTEQPLPRGGLRALANGYGQVSGRQRLVRGSESATQGKDNRPSLPPLTQSFSSDSEENVFQSAQSTWSAFALCNSSRRLQQAEL